MVNFILGFLYFVLGTALIVSAIYAIFTSNSRIIKQVEKLAALLGGIQDGLHIYLNTNNSSLKLTLFASYPSDVYETKHNTPTVAAYLLIELLREPGVRVFSPIEEA